MPGHSTRFRFGTSYCPFAKSGDVDQRFWDRDFRTMKELGFNAVRCFVAWDRIEREEGSCDFSKVDHLFELADRHAIDVILNVGGVFACYGGIYPPRWLIRDHACQEVVTDPRSQGRSFGPNRMLCLDDAVFRAKAEDFTVRMIRRYASQQRLFGWNVWNEAFLKPQCFCPATLASFRTWLQQRYAGDLDAFNRAWGSEFPVDYRSWDAIEPGMGAGFLDGGVVARLDWLRFNQDRVASWVSGVDRLVRAHDGQRRPTTSNIVTTTVTGKPEWHGHPDLWSQASSLDIAGFSYYTFFGRASDLSAGLASVRGASNDPARAFWVLETEAGQLDAPQFFPSETADGAHRVAAHWLSVLHGARCILLWKFGGRVTDSQTDTFNLTAWDGSITGRARVNAGVAADMLRHERLLLERSYRAEVAILHHGDNALYAQATDRSGDWNDAWHGAWKMLRDLQVPADLINEVQACRDGVLDRYKVLVLPHVIAIDRDLAARLAAFVRRGGSLISDQRLAVFDADGTNQCRTPGFGLEELFGAYRNDQLLDAAEVRIDLAGGGTAMVRGNLRSPLHPSAPDTAVVARWQDGSPAVTARTLGASRNVWFGFQIFRDHLNHPSPGLLPLLRDALAGAGVVSDYTVDGLPSDHEVEIGAITGDDGSRIHFIINLGGRSHRLRLRMRSAGAGPMQDLLDGSVHEQIDGAFTLELPVCGVRILAHPDVLAARTN